MLIAAPRDYLVIVAAHLKVRAVCFSNRCGYVPDNNKETEPNQPSMTSYQVDARRVAGKAPIVAEQPGDRVVPIFTRARSRFRVDRRYASTCVRACVHARSVQCDLAEPQYTGRRVGLKRSRSAPDVTARCSYSTQAVAVALALR